MHPLFLVPVLVTSLTAAPPGLSPKEMSPFLRVISASLGAEAAGRVACKDIDLAMDLKQDGLSPDAKAPLAFAVNAAQIAEFLGQGKLVVCATEAGLKQGAAIALLKEAGKPVLVVSLKNANAAGITLSDALMKIARVQK